jgi:hypothetical protein
MSSKRIWTWTGRLLALVAAVVIPACGTTGSPGGTNPNGILWNSIATGTPSGGSPTGGGSLWVDPNSGLGASTIGISNIITSADDAAYNGFYPTGGTGLSTTKIVYIAQNSHPLSTDTGSRSITDPENTLQGLINNYRSRTLGTVGGGGGGGFGGNVNVGNTQGIILSGHFQGTKSARAHCKHYAIFETNAAFNGGQNPEGDAMRTTAAGTPADTLGAPQNPDGKKGRLGKVGVTSLPPPPFPDSIGFAGPSFSDANAAFSQLTLNNAGTLGAMGWTNFCVGHWRGGPGAYYWNIIFLVSPTPAN